MILVVDPKTPQTIGVCKRPQRAKLFFHQRLLQFVSCFHKCHAPHSSTPFRRCPATPKHALTCSVVRTLGCALSRSVGFSPCTRSKSRLQYRGGGYILHA